MPARPNAYADDHRIRALAGTLAVSPDQANLAFAAYLPRDTIEAAMVERILVLQHDLHQAIRAVAARGLTPLQADRLRRTACVVDRQLERVSIRLEKRQSQPVSLLPQQYWRDTPLADVGPYEATAETLPDALLPEPAGCPLETAAEYHPDDDGDALYQLARTRIAPDLAQAHANPRATLHAIPQASPGAYHPDSAIKAGAAKDSLPQDSVPKDGTAQNSAAQDSAAQESGQESGRSRPHRDTPNRRLAA